MNVTFVTVAAANYVASVRVLASSLAEHHPDASLVLVLTDEVAGRFDPAAESFTTLTLSDVVDDASLLAFRRDRFALACTAKPMALSHVLHRSPADVVVYLDADVLVTSDARLVVEEVARRPITLTPHLLGPPARSEHGVDRELALLLSGTLNGGFVGLSRADGGEQAAAFVRWWEQRVRAACGRDLEAGVFYDQRWLDLAPGLFPGVGVVRDPGWNVAYWDLPERADGLATDDVRFLHFSGFDPESPDVPSRYTDRFRVGDLDRPLRDWFETYARLLTEAGHAECRRWDSAYDVFADGTCIPPLARRLHAELAPETATAFGDPFDAHAGGWLAWLQGPSAPGSPISRFWYEVHRRRPDLGAAFPDPTGVDRDAFLRWTEAFGEQELEAAGWARRR